MKTKGNYGIDSPGIVAALFALGCVLLLVASLTHSVWWWVAYGLAGYFLLGAGGMLFYSKVGSWRCENVFSTKFPGEATKEFWTWDVDAACWLWAPRTGCRAAR